MKRINLFYKEPPIGFKFIPGDRHLLKYLRGLIKSRKISGLEKVFVNLCKGFDELNINYTRNLPFNKIAPGEPVVVLGSGKYVLQGYNKSNPVIAGIGLMTHPKQWPTLFKDYPVAVYLQHSKWTKDLYTPYFGENNCDIWPAGIDTQRWSPGDADSKPIDFLVYNKIMWNKDEQNQTFKDPILKKLDNLGLTYKEIVYGHYHENEYFELLKQCRAMLFLCEHESQGFACCEALSMNVPVLAWDPGYWLDPMRIEWGTPKVKSTSIPFFDGRCGLSFKDATVFDNVFESFMTKLNNGAFKPREYILNRLTLKKSAERMLEIIHKVYK